MPAKNFRAVLFDIQIAAFEIQAADNKILIF